MHTFLICVLVVLCTVLWWRAMLAWLAILVLILPLIARARSARNKCSSSSHEWMMLDAQLCVLNAHRKVYAYFGKRKLSFDDLLRYQEELAAIRVQRNDSTTFTDIHYRSVLDAVDRVESQLIYVQRIRKR